MLSVPGKISVQIPSSLCMHLLSARNNHGNIEWAVGAECFVFRGRMFLFCFKTSWSQINKSILYSEYESPNYSSPLLGKMSVFGPCGIFKTAMKEHDFFIYFLVTWCAILQTRIKSYLHVCYSEVWKVSSE